MGTVKAVCTSEIKGIQKSETDSIELRPDWGIENDAHAGKWHRQVSLLSYEKIEITYVDAAEMAGIVTFIDVLFKTPTLSRRRSQVQTPYIPPLKHQLRVNFGPELFLAKIFMPKSFS